ncbi:amidohydrolase family protein [Bifidobacterium pseudolongum subsp. globosum]|uniref:Amidohydrolase family protein n=1 Tax=Bifidobacterium pseudolongum subsp. globosum TaxID=1690 RepID=A0A2N3QGR1_9BIFI|nr:amidohydrolase family protein [Bifidobacterium pseudolongum]PKU90461.1 amidohydrolase family protein [Bifidobacterium pseudolongum subsp. globosum]
MTSISTRTMTRFPHIRFVVPHCGAFLPYMLQRFAGVSRILAQYGVMEPTDVYEEARGLWYDVAGDPEPVALDMLRMVAPADHIVYGSDYPHSPAPIVVPKKRALEADPRFADVDLRANGMRLLGGSA